MDFEKCNKIINYLDYPNRVIIWTFFYSANNCQPVRAWHCLTHVANSYLRQSSLGTQNNPFMTCFYPPCKF